MKNKQAWIVILGFVFLSSVFIAAGLGKILNLIFPAAALGIGVFLYSRYPIFYIGYTWWLWFLTPWVRRLVDYRSGFTDPSPILLAPYLTTLVSLITLFKCLPKVHNQQGLPFILSFLGVFYGFFVGLIHRSPIEVGISLLDWLAPISFGFHVFLNWPRYPELRRIFEQTFIWGVIVMGVYGIVQYIIAPEWDRYWLLNAEINSAGNPEAMGIRVWSTMHSPGPFGVVMMAGLLLLFDSKGKLYVFAAIPGYLSFLLSLVRSAWGGWMAGLLALTAFVKSNTQIRIIVTILVMFASILPLTIIDPFSQVISARLETLSDIGNDDSAQARQEIYENMLGEAVTRVLGEGVGSPNFDSGILTMLFSLGWLGTSFYMGGMITLLYSLLKPDTIPLDTFLSRSRAIVIGVFFQLILGAVMLGASGMILWGFLGMGLAAQRHSKAHRLKY